MYTFLEALTGSRAESDQKKALACQKAEHDFAGNLLSILLAINILTNYLARYQYSYLSMSLTIFIYKL